MGAHGYGSVATERQVKPKGDGNWSVLEVGMDCWNLEWEHLLILSKVQQLVEVFARLNPKDVSLVLFYCCFTCYIFTHVKLHACNLHSMNACNCTY